MPNIPGWQDTASPVKLEWISRYINISGKLKVLDIGSGAGWYSMYLASKGCDVVAIDKNPLFQEKENLKIIRADLESKIDLPDETFDCILAWDIIEHLEKEEQIIKEIFRLLKKGGRLLMSVPNADDSMIADKYLTYCHFKDKTHKREYTDEEVKRKFAQVGFTVLKVAPTGGDGYPYIILNFIENKLAKLITRVFLKVTIKTGIVNVKSCHGDIFGALSK